MGKAPALHLALHEVTNQLQIMTYRRENTPIRDRAEVYEDLNLRIQNMNGCNKIEWRKRMIELAAYALFAAVSDEPNP